MEKIKVAVVGAAGKMGQEVVKAISRDPELSLVLAVDHAHSGQDVGLVAGIGRLGVSISPFLETSLLSSKPDVLVDFTRYEAALSSIQTGLKSRVACVVGTTGFSSKDFDTIAKWCEENQTPALIAPNFAIGAVLLMKFAKEVAKYFSWSEIVEFHHEKKLDAPSGTAIRTAEMMLESREAFEKSMGEEKIPGARGAEIKGIHLHSVRLPGFVAHQEVLFGGVGQILTIRHDSLSRESFMPGVLLAIRKVRSLKGLVVGLENILD
jgi:4-hydroxy-tetrahydrodipicolinate reductase